ncbi:FG-GAP-like repeat-containing protein [Nonomuraea sp. NPDC050153]|uniref:FG-GAP-like repeat-containing protein n=1 Tax=Nonomuraea sp. NPDC050153 TaxID=3364359 RepID=UPI003794C6EF
MSLLRVPAEPRSATAECGLPRELVTTAPAGTTGMEVLCGEDAVLADATLVAADDDLVIRFAFEGVTQAMMRDAIEEVYQPGVSLSEQALAVLNGQREHFEGAPADIVDISDYDDVDVDGTLQATSDGLAIVIPSADVGEASWGWWWRSVVVLMATVGVRVATFAFCVSFAAPPASALFINVCSAVSQGIAAFSGYMVASYFSGRAANDPQLWAEALAFGLVAALLPGAGWDLGKNWMSKALPGTALRVGRTLKDVAVAVRGWAGETISNLVNSAGEKWAELSELVWDAIVREAHRRGIPIASSLRVMPLGDSITYGVESSDGNGYRDELYAYLKGSWSSVDFVGSVRAGSMSDRDNQGHPGKRIGQIAAFAYCSVPRYQPNVITLHAGTNDMNQNYNLPAAPTRLKKLINQALTHSPRATVLVAKLIPTAKAGLQPRIDAFNAALPGMVEDLQNEGKHVLLVDMKRVLVSDGLENDAHPTDAGYAKMADAWYAAISAADAKGWIQTPLPENEADGCDPADSPVDDDLGDSPVDSGDPGESPVGSGETALGAGWRALGVIAPGYGTNLGRTIIAELNGDQRADYLQVGQDGGFRASVNTVGTPGQPDWVDVGTYAPADDAQGEEVRFADLNGDGRDDYLVVGSDSKVRAYINFPGTGNRLRFVHWGIVFGEETFNRDNLRFADVTGDGRDDILRVSAEGAVHVYRNMWDPNSGQVGSEPQPPDWRLWLDWAGGTRGSSLEAVRFADGDGDGQADYLQVGLDGAVHAFLNRGGGGNGSFEARYDWAHASDYPRKYVRFADISGDGKADYLVVYDGGAVRAWLNRGGN